MKHQQSTVDYATE